MLSTDIWDTEPDTPLPYTESNHVETHQEGQQCLFNVQSALQPVPKRWAFDRINEETYTAVCGVYSPEKMSPNREAHKRDFPYHCPRCDKRLSTRGSVKMHFPDCIAKYGNPDALKWNDHVSLKPTPYGISRDPVRKKKFDDTIKAYSGTIVPSKLSPGQKIIKFKSKSKKGDSICAICGGGTFAYSAHVKSHFQNCVKKYGNPRGANWYDGLEPRSKKRFLKKVSNNVANVPRTM